MTWVSCLKDVKNESSEVMSAMKQVCGVRKPDYTTQLNSETQKFPRNPSTLSNSSLEDSYLSLAKDTFPLNEAMLLSRGRL